MIISRLPDGKWSGASAIVVDFDLPPSVDVADIVIVANDQHGLDLISSPSGILGKGLTVEPGPMPESDAYAAPQRKIPRKKDVTLYYVKSKGHLTEMDLKPMVIREAHAENERFYEVPGVSAREILSGQTKTSSSASDLLYSTLNAACACVGVRVGVMAVVLSSAGHRKAGIEACSASWSSSVRAWRRAGRIL